MKFKSKIKKTMFSIIDFLFRGYFTYWIRPKYPSKIKNVPAYFDDDVIIVMQGPYIKKNNFTLENLRYYRKIFPNTIIVLSIWNDCSDYDLKTINKIEKVHVVLNEKPNKIGRANLNLQITNTISGINKAIELGAKYICKCRTDQRMYNKYSLLYMKNMVQKFPVEITDVAKGRIVACSLGTFSERLYNICDMVIFGYSEDVKLYFDVPLDLNSGGNPNDYLDPIEYAKIRPGEIYFSTNYIEKCGFDLKWSFEDSDYYRNKLFCIIDFESIDLFWGKYTKKEYIWKKYSEYIHKRVTHMDWLIEQ